MKSKKRCILIRSIKILEYGTTLMKQPLNYFKIKESNSKNQKPALLMISGLKPIDMAGSKMLFEILKSAIDETEEMCILTKCYDIFIFVEMNPDGRLLGNSVYSACGNDLTQITEPSKVLHPEITQFHKVLKEIDLKHKIYILIEFSDCWKSLIN